MPVSGTLCLLMRLWDIIIIVIVITAIVIITIVIIIHAILTQCFVQTPPMRAGPKLLEGFILAPEYGTWRKTIEASLFDWLVEIDWTSTRYSRQRELQRHRWFQSRVVQQVQVCWSPQVAFFRSRRRRRRRGKRWQRTPPQRRDSPARFPLERCSLKVVEHK